MNLWKLGWMLVVTMPGGARNGPGRRTAKALVMYLSQIGKASLPPVVSPWIDACSSVPTQTMLTRLRE